MIHNLLYKITIFPFRCFVYFLITFIIDEYLHIVSVNLHRQFTIKQKLKNFINHSCIVLNKTIWEYVMSESLLWLVNHYKAKKLSVHLKIHGVQQFSQNLMHVWKQFLHKTKHLSLKNKISFIWSFQLLLIALDSTLNAKGRAKSDLTHNTLYLYFHTLSSSNVTFLLSIINEVRCAYNLGMVSGSS